MSGSGGTPELSERFLDAAYELAKTRPRGSVNSYAVADTLGMEATGENIAELDGVAKAFIKSGHLARGADEPGMFRVTLLGSNTVLRRRRTRP